MDEGQNMRGAISVSFLFMMQYVCLVMPQSMTLTPGSRAYMDTGLDPVSDSTLHYMKSLVESMMRMEALWPFSMAVHTSMTATDCLEVCLSGLG